MNNMISQKYPEKMDFEEKLEFEYGDWRDQCTKDECCGPYNCLASHEAGLNSQCCKFNCKYALNLKLLSFTLLNITINEKVYLYR